MEDTTTEVAEKMFELNVLGPIALTRAALPFLLSRCMPYHPLDTS